MIPRRALRVPAGLLPRLLLVAAAGALSSCHIEEPFVRDNHWDPGSTAKKTLIAPDSTFSIGERFTVTVDGEPPLPSGPLQITWISNGLDNLETQVFASGYGEFVVSKAHAGYELIAVTAKFDDVQVSAYVHVGQKVATLDLYCGALVTSPCDGTPVASGADLLISSRMLDANTNALGHRNSAMARSTYFARDPVVLSVAPTTPNTAGTFRVRGVSAGATWLVVRVDGVSDSVRVVVSP